MTDLYFLKKKTFKTVTLKKVLENGRKAAIGIISTDVFYLFSRNNKIYFTVTDNFLVYIFFLLIPFC